MSVLNAVLEIQEQQLSPTVLNDIVKRGGTVGHRSFEYTTAQALDAVTGCINREFGDTRRDRMRNLLMHLIKELQPPWAFSIPFGRKVVGEIVTDDTRQCLRVAELLSQPADTGCRKWWDSLAAEFRQLRNDKLLEIGRQGEELTLELETRRLEGTGFSPEWIAIEDNTAGYDIKSRDPQSLDERFIEVKATTVAIPQFHFTRNEWLTASLRPEQWRLHLWVLPDQKFFEYTFEQVAVHMPGDQGAGRWQEVTVGMSEAT